MHARPVVAVTLRASSVRLAFPQCLTAPQNFERTVEARLGLLGLYRGDALITTGCFAGEKENPHGAYDRSGRMLVGCFIRWRTAQDMRISDAQHVELCGMPITAWMPMR